MRNNRKAAEQLFATWRELTKLHEKQGRLILALVSHPDSTEESVGRVLGTTLSVFKETREALTKHRPVVQAALEAQQMPMQAYEVQRWTP